MIAAAVMTVALKAIDLSLWRLNLRHEQLWDYPFPY